MTRLMIVMYMAAMAVGCSASSPTAPTSATAGVLTDQIRLAMQEAIADEYRAETIYQGVITDFGSVQPFVNILTAEERHSAALMRLFAARGLTAPGNTWTLATVPRYTAVPAACAAGVVAERENVALYDRYLGLDLPTDVRQVFQNNRRASIDNHLPAFERCAT